MNKSKIILPALLIFVAIFSIIPNAVPQTTVYTFHGASGDEKILKVRTVDNTSLEDLYGTNWVDVVELFGEGASKVGAQYKTVFIACIFLDNYSTGSLGLGDLNTTKYIIDDWSWTTEDFTFLSDKPLMGMETFHNPTELTTLINAMWFTNVTVQNAAMFLAQLPTPVDQYLGAIVGDDKWEASENTVIHNAEAGDLIFQTAYQYLEDCTETWTYDKSSGALIGYKLQDEEDNTIYEFSLEASSGSSLPGYDLPALFGAVAIGIVSLIYIITKKKKV
jgi:hypothetical protein